MQIKIDKVQKSCKDTPPVYWESFKKNKLGLTKQMGDMYSQTISILSLVVCSLVVNE